jgi:hypothetical protein
MFESNGLLDLPSPPALDTASSTGPGSTTHLDTPVNMGAEMDFDFADDDGIFASLPVDTVASKSPIAQTEEKHVEYDGPDEWEEEMLAMQEMEAEEELARTTASLARASQATPRSTQHGRGESKAKGKGKASAGASGMQAGFGDPDLFESLDDFRSDLDHPGPSSAAARRTRLSSIDINIGEGDVEDGLDDSLASPPAAQRATKSRAAVPSSMSLLQDRVEKCYLPALRAETASGKMLYIKRRNKPKPRALPVSLAFHDGRDVGVGTA